ncbi:MAG: hypothetical protein Q4C25_00005 [Bacillota bacterium]|nr:hypothetical protein [Bacillota bacterium]
MQSSSGEWSGNICDFYFRVYNKVIKDIKIPFKTKGGVPNIFHVWEDEGWIEPVIEEQFDPDRMILTLEFRKKATEKTQKQMDMILDHMNTDTWYKAEEFIDLLGVKLTQTKELLRMLVRMEALEINRQTKGKRYRKRNDI